MTNLQRLTIILTAFNLILLAFGLAQLRPAVAQGVAPRGADPFIKMVTKDGRERTIKP
jgi:hypothetical protein